MKMLEFIAGALVGGAVATLFLSCFRVGAEYDKQTEGAYRENRRSA